MFPRMGGEIEAWPDSEDEVAEFQPEDAGAGGEAPGQLEPAFQDEDELEVTIDEEVLNSTTKLKTLQEWCRKLGMATSGGKTKCLRRLRSYRVVEEQKMAVEVSRKMYEEGKREAVALPVPKLPSKTEQEIHNLTHIPFAPWCQCCVATRAKEDARKEEARGDVTDRGKPIISFDYGYTFMEEEEEEKQYGTCLYVAESETKAVMAIPVLAKGTVSLKQVTEEIVRFSMSTCGGQPIILMADGERATKQILRAVQHCRAAIGLGTEIRAQARHGMQAMDRKMANCLRVFAEAKAGAKIRGSSHLYPWSFRHAAWLVTSASLALSCRVALALSVLLLNACLLHHLP